MTGRTIKLAMVITELEIGGAERCLVSVARGVDKRRFEPTVYSLAQRPADHRSGLVAQLEQDAIPVHFLGFSSKWQLPAAIGQLAQALREQGPQVVQSMLFHANIVTGLALRRLDGVPWCAGIRVADPSHLRQSVECRVIKDAAQVACVSRLVADYAARTMRLPREKLLVVPNGIDSDDCMRRIPADLQALGVPRSRRVITCVSRLVKQKGLDQLLAAMPRLAKSLPEHDVLLVGDGPQASALRRLASRLGIAARVHFCGFQPNVLEILLASDLLVLPSRWEGMPNVLLEAMACQRPVVCTEVEGVLEVLGPLSQHQTVPLGKPQLLADKVLRILGDADLASSLGQANHRRVAECFSLGDMIHRYELLFEGLSHGLKRA